MTQETVITAKNLQVCIKDKRNKNNIGSPVVHDISFSVKQGETLCIVGESGSGKSVTSMAIMGLLPADSLIVSQGSIYIDDEDILSYSPAQMRRLRASKVAMVFQEPMTALNPVHKVGRQIEEVLKLHQKSLSAKERKKKVMDMLSSVHLPDIERIYDSYPHQLSGGQRQRIVIAMALILQPKLLIADEPTTALDVTTQKQILQLIKELQAKHGTAVIFITHDFGVVADIADRILVMNQGREVETGDKLQVLSNPQADYTRMLVSSVPSLVPHDRQLKDSNTVLTVKNLNKYYTKSKFFFGASEKLHAAVDVNFQIKQREIVGIVGESGSGKSTVARCIMRLTDSNSGEILLDGTDINRLSRRELMPLRHKIQMIFQDPYRSLNPRQRIGESVIEGLINYGVSRKEALQKASKALELVGLPTDALTRYPHQFSGGQRQRICIARALVMEPAILVADEAVSALDVSVQAQVLDLLEEIRERAGVGVLFITHDLRVAAQICDTVIVMKKGHIVESGPVSDVLSKPQHEYTQSLLDAAPGRHWDFQNFAPVQEYQSNINPPLI